MKLHDPGCDTVREELDVLREVPFVFRKRADGDR